MLEQQNQSLFEYPWERPTPASRADVPERPLWLGGPPGESLHDHFDEDFLKMKASLPYRRHSLAHETLPQTKTMGEQKWTRERSASVFMGSIWSPTSTTSNGPNGGVTTIAALPSPTTPTVTVSSAGSSVNALASGLSTSPWDPISVSSSSASSSPSSLLGRSTTPHFSFGDQEQEPLGHLRGMRRLSLSPLPSNDRPSYGSTLTTDYFEPRDMLSSVPEEPTNLIPYRRHSLAGPLLPVTPTLVRNRQRNRSNFLLEPMSHYFDPASPNNVTTAPSVTAAAAAASNTFISAPHDPSVSWCMVEFKAGRAEIYYSLTPIDKDDWVIVEADRGRDLGKVVAKDLPADQITLLLHSTMQSNSGLIDPSEPHSNTTKQVCRRATPSEITLLVTKRQDEQKALLICQTKGRQKNLMMDIVDAEYQWDRRKLTFYFVAERRVDFRELVRDLFKIYKTRIWMCSVNAMGKKQPVNL